MKNIDLILKGFLFSLGFIPVVIFSTWFFHSWPLMGTGDWAEFSVDKSQLEIGELQLSRSHEGLTGLGEITNRSSKPCTYVQLTCDLLLDGKIIAHESAIISDLSGNTTRGYTVYFTGVPESIDPAGLKAQISVAQAINLDD